MNWVHLIEFDVACKAAGVETPAPIVRGQQIRDLANEHAKSVPGGLLSLSDHDVTHTLEAFALRNHSGSGRNIGLDAGVEEFMSRLSREIREETIPLLEDIVKELQPRFDEATAPLAAAAKFGITAQTTSDHVIDMVNEKAANAWRAVPAAWAAVAPIATLRRKMSKLFAVAPYIGEHDEQGTNYSVCFAAGDNWSADAGYLIDGKKGQHTDWLAIARDGFRLNTPSEVEEKHATRRRTKYAASVAS